MKLDDIMLEALVARPGRSVRQLANYEPVRAFLDALEMTEKVERYLRVRGSLRRLRDQGLAYCARGLHGWYPVGKVIPRVPLDPETQEALKEVRAHRNKKRARRQKRVSKEEAREKLLAYQKLVRKLRAQRLAAARPGRPSARRGL